MCVSVCVFVCAWVGMCVCLRVVFISSSCSQLQLLIQKDLTWSPSRSPVAGPPWQVSCDRSPVADPAWQACRGDYCVAQGCRYGSHCNANSNQPKFHVNFTCHLMPLGDALA